ncbi:hypothetical protein J6W34_05200 [bacterium]|nr:hypothetical protein [bacterium]
MVNDLTTLSGALIECKDQLITELANQGVTATYDPTTGLLGLIHKISEIPTGTATIVLATNKNILSYYDSETATLIATHSQGAGKTVEIYNAVTGSKIGDMTDNNDGTYSYTYSSTGVGDISMTAVAGQTESNSVTIEDCLFYDASSSSNISKYTTNNLTHTYDTTEQAYKLQQVSTSNTHGTSTLQNSAFPKDINISLDMKLINTGTSGSTNNSQPAIKFGNFFARIINAKSANVNRITLMNGQGTADISYTNCTITNEVWYHLDLSIESDVVTFTLKQGDTTVATVTGNVSSYLSNTNSFALAQGVNHEPYTFMKNIKIKPIPSS